jgi:hypothetical protein
MFKKHPDELVTVKTASRPEMTNRRIGNLRVSHSGERADGDTMHATPAPASASPAMPRDPVA